MRLLPPVPWHLITPGTVVLYDGPRAVIMNMPHSVTRTVLLEGLPPIVVDPRAYAQPVQLDATDAIGTLYAAGLNPTPIEGN
jgi:hypothetical protein